MKNGEMWYDNEGNTIQAHGGMILEYHGRYYWYGENKNGETSYASDGNTRIDFIGISCYSSKDLMDWTYEGLALEASKDPKSDIHKSKVCERPKVIYNKKNNNFVMWMHVDSEDYTFAAAGVAVSDSPVGPFDYIESIRPANRSDARDLTVFEDIDGRAYLVHSSDWNKTLRISELNEDFTDFTGAYTKATIEQEREAPAIIYHEGLYYMVTSGCTGWEPNSALYAISNNIMGAWKLIDNPCMGENYRQTFYGQSSYIFKIGNEPYLMLDHWKPENLKASGYSILPMHIKGDYVEIPWQDEFKI